MGSVKHILVAAERGSTMLSLAEVEAIADVGLQGDRYTSAQNRKSADCQHRLIEAENIEAFAEDAGVSLAPHEPRRNLVTVGVGLNEVCGQHFSVRSVGLQGLELCEPCGTFAESSVAESSVFETPLRKRRPNFALERSVRGFSKRAAGARSIVAPAARRPRIARPAHRGRQTT